GPPACRRAPAPRSGPARTSLAAAAAGFAVAMPATAAATGLQLVNVAVLDPYGGATALLDDLDVKRQIDARQRMIRVEQHLVALDAHHRDDRRVGIGAGLKTVANVELALDRQQFAQDLLHLRVVAFAVALDRRHIDARLGAGRKTGHGLVEPLDDLPHALQITDRPAAGGGVEHATLGIEQRVVKGDDVFGHVARSLPPAPRPGQGRKAGASDVVPPPLSLFLFIFLFLLEQRPEPLTKEKEQE